MICESCAKETPKRTNGPQKYCPECSAKKDLARKAAWSKRNPPSPETIKCRNDSRRLLSREIGKEVSKANCSSFLDLHIEPKSWKEVKLAIPWSSMLLKNHVWSYSRGHVFLRQEARQAEEALIVRIKMALGQEYPFFHNKIWLSIYAQKPDHRAGDAINLIDRIADAVKKAINIDDRWFSIRRVDWEIAKVNPRIFIEISQEATEHGSVCSTCGLILGFDSFTKNKRTKLGISRECRNCSGQLDALKRKGKKSVICLPGPT